MTENTVQVSLRVRSDIITKWQSVNPTLAIGEFGYDITNKKLKIGNGSSTWNELPYITDNGDEITVDTDYFTIDTQGNLTIQKNFLDTIIAGTITKENNKTIKTIDGTTNSIRIDYGTDQFNQPNDPPDETSIATKFFVKKAVALAGHITKTIVESLNDIPSATNPEANTNTIYMLKDENASGDQYKEYMYIEGTNGTLELVQIGDTSINLNGLVTGDTEEDHLIKINADGALVDSGYEASRLEIATSTTLGVVKSGNGTQTKSDPGYDRIIVDNSGFMTVNHVSTTTLYVPDGDQLILNGGNA